MNKFKKDDTVIVISGKSKGVVAVISKSFPKRNKYILDAAHFCTKHVKPAQESKGGIKQIPLQIDGSNLSHFDKTKKKKLRAKFIIKDSVKKRELK